MIVFSYHHTTTLITNTKRSVILRILTADDVRRAVPMQKAIEANLSGYIALATDQANVPVRSAVPTNRGVHLTMPAHIKGDSTSAVKVVSVFSDNPQNGLPTIHALVLILDAQTGVPLALVEGGVLTAIRTGAGSGVATDLLARPDAHILGVIGTGVQARTQVEAVCAVRNITEIRLYSRTNPQSMAEEIADQYDANVTVAGSASAAADGADVIVLATNSTEPVLQLADVAPGTHINGIGSFMPHMQEVAADIVTQAKVVVDHHESVWEEAGDLIIPRDQGIFSASDVYAEIGEIANGSKPGRTNTDEITFFKSVGNAVQDAVMARVIAHAIQEDDLGAEVEF